MIAVATLHLSRAGLDSRVYSRLDAIMLPFKMQCIKAEYEHEPSCGHQYADTMNRCFVKLYSDDDQDKACTALSAIEREEGIAVDIMCGQQEIDLQGSDDLPQRLALSNFTHARRLRLAQNAHVFAQCD